jgi:hypothetical protein
MLFSNSLSGVPAADEACRFGFAISKNKEYDAKPPQTVSHWHSN